MTTLLNQIIQHEGEHTIYEVNPNFPDAESTGWKWKKYNDGFCEMWGYSSVNNSPYTTTLMNGFYQRTEHKIFPFSFITVPQIIHNSTCGSGWSLPSTLQSAITTSYCNVYFATSSGGTQYCYTQMYVWARWK